MVSRGMMEEGLEKRPQRKAQVNSEHKGRGASAAWRLGAVRECEQERVAADLGLLEVGAGDACSRQPRNPLP